MSRSLFIVTGANGGFGGAVLRQLDTLYGESALIIATARNPVTIATAGFKATVKTIAADFSVRGAELEVVCRRVASLAGRTDYFSATLINNHGALNQIGRGLASFNGDETDEYLHLNVTSFHVLTSAFLEEFGKMSRIRLVNISSLAAISPFPELGLYSAGKAARMVLYKTLAQEYPNVTVLNYSPGPMKTAMTKDIATTAANPQLAASFAKFDKEDTWVKVDDSARKMLQLLKSGSFESGQQVDYYDIC